MNRSTMDFHDLDMFLLNTHDECDSFNIIVLLMYSQAWLENICITKSYYAPQNVSQMFPQKWV